MRVLVRFRVATLVAIASLLGIPTSQPEAQATDAFVVNLLADEISAEAELLYTIELPRLPYGLAQSTIVNLIDMMAEEHIESGFGCDEIYEAANLALAECLSTFVDPSTLTPKIPELDPCGLYIRATPEAALSTVIDKTNGQASLEGDVAAADTSDAITNKDGSHGTPPDDDCPHAHCLLSGWDQNGESICLAWLSLCPLDPNSQNYIVLNIVQIPGTSETFWIIEGPDCPPADENCVPSTSQEELVEDLLARLAGYGYGSGANGGPCGNIQPEQYREGAGSQTGNPVLVAEGVKTDRASDLYVPLRGTDFELTRHYNAGDLIRSEQFPWMVGTGWGLSTDGWIGVTRDEDLGDMISITTYPLETSERYVGEPGQTTGIFEPMGPSTSLVRTGYIQLVLYGEDDDDPNTTGSYTRFSVFIYDDPGSGQIAFFNTKGNKLYNHLHGRIAQRRDASGNVWTYRYVRHTDDESNFTDPRLLAVYLNHRVDSDQSCDARIVFDWDTGDQTNPGTGMVRSVQAQRPTVDQQLGLSWHTVQRVNYIYSDDDGDDIDGDGNPETFSPDLVRSGVTGSRLLMVEREELVNVPLTDDLNWPASESDEQWHRTYSMYRYGGVGGRMSHEFTPRELEYFAENGSIGATVDEVIDVCAWLLTSANTQTASLLGSSIEVQDLASKIIEYWEIPSSPPGITETTMADEAPGFPWGALEGRVKSEILQSACGCSGGGASQNRKIDFNYARKDILDFVTRVELSIVDLLGGTQTILTDIPHPRNLSLTVQTESIKEGSSWVRYKRVSQWSYDEVYRLRVAYLPGGLGYRFRVIPVPFTILNRVEEFTGEELPDTKPAGRVWWSYMDFENHMLARTFPTTAVQAVDLDTNDLIDYEPDISTTSSESDPGIAVTIRAGSMFVYSNHDEYGRITEQGVAKVTGESPASNLSSPVFFPTQTTSYVHSGGADKRLDLVAKVRSYPTNPSGSPTEGYHYATTHHEETESDFAEETVPGLVRKRITRIGTISNRESTTQNGPGGQVSSWVGFDQYGQAIWTADAAGRVNETSYDTLTGAAIQATRNADPATAIPSGQMPDPAYTADWPSYGGSEPTATTTAKVDVHGRTRLRVSETGLVTATDFRLAQIPVYLGEPTDPSSFPNPWPSSNLDSYLQVTTLPPAADTGFAGPATRQWVDAAYNVIQSSTYAVSGASWDGTAFDSLLTDVSVGAEHSRTAHVYGLSGNLREKLTWHDLDNATTPGGPTPGVYSERFSYDPYGRVVQSLSADRQLTVTGYDIKDRVVAQWAGGVTEAGVSNFPFTALDPLATSAANGEQSSNGATVQLLSTVAYDVRDIDFSNGEFPISYVGDGLASATRTYVSHSPLDFRDTRTIFDWRNRARLSYTVDPSTGDWDEAFPDTTLSVSEFDNLDRPTKSIDFSPGELVALGGGLWDSLRTDLRNDSLDTTTLSNAAVIARSETLYGPRGLVYRARAALDPNSSITEWSESNTFYDAKGRVLASVGADGPISKPTFDGLGRTIRTITTSGEEARGISVAFSTAVESNPASVAAPVLSISTTEYDSATGNGLLPVRSTTQQRAHDATGDGIGANPITTYATTGYDSANRPLWSASYGTNSTGYDSGGSAPGLSQPARSVNVVVTETEYDEIGRPHITTDNKDRKYRSYYDALGRIVASIDNYVQPTSGDLLVEWNSTKGHYVVSGRDDKDPETGSDKNRVTSMVYDGAGNIVRRVAHLLNGSAEEEKHQVTEFVYDYQQYLAGSGSPALSTNKLKSNGFLYEVRYPDPSTGAPSDAAADVVRFALNLAGEQVERVDQNGTSLAQTRDGLGRIERETASIDPALLASPTSSGHLRDEINVIETLYDSFGRVERITSLNKDGSTEIVVNELKNEFDNRGRLTRFYQEQHGPVDSETDFTEYTFADIDRSDNWTSRLDSVKYPTESRSGSDRTSLEHIFDATALDDEIGRLSGIRWAGKLPNQSTATRGISHTYLGTSRRVKSVFGDVDAQSTGTPLLVRDRTINPSTGATSAGSYPGLDPLGRVSHHVWSLGDHNPSTRPALFNLEYQYDETSNIVARLDSRQGTQSDIRHTTYAFDEIDRLVKTVRSANPLTTGIKGSQDWTLDANGNWINRVRQLGGSNTEDEDRQFDATNEITNLDVDAPSGTSSREYIYDDAGNLVAQQLADAVGVENRRVYQYDAWNRLVQVGYETRSGGDSWGSTKVATSYSYFGNNFRATRNASETTSTTPTIRTRFYYDPDWMLLEERSSDVTSLTTAAWHWQSSGTDFSSGTPSTVAQYIWDPTAQDELAAVQVGTLSGSDWVFSQRWWSLTDRNHNVVGMIQEVWDAGQSKFRLKTEGLERIRYRPYGFAERQILADINGDGSVNLDDLNFVMTNFGAAIGSSGYAAQIDTDSSGSINLDDHNAVLIAFGTSVPTDGSLWKNAPGMVGYGGGLYDELAGLYLFRNRYYDPTEGRWITRDPAGYVDGLNLYQYVQGNPLMYFDPFGLGPIEWLYTGQWNPPPDVYAAAKRGAASTYGVRVLDNALVSGGSGAVTGGMSGAAVGAGAGSLAGGVGAGPGALIGGGLGASGGFFSGVLSALFSPDAPLSDAAKEGAIGGLIDGVLAGTGVGFLDDAACLARNGARLADDAAEATVKTADDAAEAAVKAADDAVVTSQHGSYRPAATEFPQHPRTGEPFPVIDTPQGQLTVNTPHTQLRTATSSRTGETYLQARDFSYNGRPVQDIHFSNHGMPNGWSHQNPHTHLYLPNPTGGTRLRTSGHPYMIPY